jgi:hypothetical protein
MLLIGTLAACGADVVNGSPSGSAIPAPSGRMPTATAAGSPAPSERTASLPPIAGPCVSDVDMGVLPTWARAGFSDPEPAMPHVMSTSGDVVAILFGYPLSSPPRAQVNNKILWVLRDGLDSPVEISAQRMGAAIPAGEPVSRRLDDGFGPSIVDLPTAGCWRLTLMFAGRTDSIDLEYVPSTTS